MPFGRTWPKSAWMNSWDRHKKTPSGLNQTGSVLNGKDDYGAKTPPVVIVSVVVPVLPTFTGVAVMV